MFFNLDIFNNLLADREYNSNSIVEKAQEQGIAHVTPAKKNRKEKRDYDKGLYKLLYASVQLLAAFVTDITNIKFLKSY